MTGKHEATQEAFRNVTTLIDPWMKTMRSYVAETEKFQQAAVDGLTKAIDNGHKMAREGLDMYASMGTTIQKQIHAQVERTIDLVNTFTP